MEKGMNKKEKEWEEIMLEWSKERKGTDQKA